MYSTVLLDEKIEKEYEKLRAERANALRQQTEELYSLFPQIKIIDNKISTLAVTQATKIISEGISPKEAVELVNAEREKLLFERNDILKKNGYILSKIPYSCELCKDTGVHEGKKCTCYMSVLKKILLSQIDGSKNLSFNLGKDVFDNFSLSWYSKEIDAKVGVSPYENMLYVYRYCKEFCENFDKEKKNLYFYGHSGTGKTFMASCIANDLIMKGYTIVYQSAYKLFQFMEDYKFNRIDRSANASLYDNIYNSDLLIIDDLGTEFGTTYTCSVFFDILNTRILNEKSTLISSNLTLNNLENNYTDRVSSRIIGNFELMRFMGDDIRIAKKQNGR